MEVSMWTGLPVKLPSSRIVKLKTVNKLPSIIMLIFPDIFIFFPHGNGLKVYAVPVEIGM